MAVHKAVAAIDGEEVLLVVAALAVFLSVPVEGAAGNGVETGLLRLSHGEVQGHHAVAASDGDERLLVDAWGGIRLSVPYEAAAAFVMLEFDIDLVVDHEMQVDDAVAAIHTLQVELPVINAGVVVLEAEAVAVVDAWRALPAAAVVDGDVIGGTCRDVKEQISCPGAFCMSI